MDPVKYAKESDVSDPLKHLLSLNWESTSISKSKDFHTDAEQSKSVKKVSFSDEVEEILCNIDTNEINATNLEVLEKSRTIYTDHAYCAQFKEKLSDTSFQNKVLPELNSKVEMNDACSDDEFDNLENNSAITFDPNSLTNKNILREIQDFEIEKDTQLCENEKKMKKLHEATQMVSNVSEIDINNLATEIESMSIHPSQESYLLESQVCEKGFSASTNKTPEHHSEIHDSFIGDGKSGSSLQKNTHLFSEEKNEHRIYQKLCNEKQSRKLNSLFPNEASITNASDLKTTVFKAWYKVKNKTKVSVDIGASSSKSRAKSSIETSLKKSKEQIKPISKHVHTLWKKSKKNKLLQSEHKEQHKNTVSQEISKSEEEEREMAFKSWKKRKDEILKNEYLNKKRMEQQFMEISSMNDIQKKKDSEEAFFAWKAHKSCLKETECKRKMWLHQKEKEEYAKKSLRDKEALDMYYLWLETKHFIPEKNSTSSMQLKPPWIPPGKSSK